MHRPPCSKSPWKPWETALISMSMLHVDVKELAAISVRVTKSCTKIKIKNEALPIIDKRALDKNPTNAIYLLLTPTHPS